MTVSAVVQHACAVCTKDRLCRLVDVGGSKPEWLCAPCEAYVSDDPDAPTPEVNPIGEDEKPW